MGALAPRAPRSPGGEAASGAALASMAALPARRAVRALLLAFIVTGVIVMRATGFAGSNFQLAGASASPLIPACFWTTPPSGSRSVPIMSISDAFISLFFSVPASIAMRSMLTGSFSS